MSFTVNKVLVSGGVSWYQHLCGRFLSFEKLNTNKHKKLKMDLQNEWKLLTEIVNDQDICEGYIPTLWEITRWISANEGKLLKFYWLWE